MGTSIERGALGALRANLWPAGRGAGLKLRLGVIFAMSLVSSSLAAVALRLAIIAREGSTAVTARSAGS